MTNFLDRIAKRAGLYVSRPVLNGDAWVKWATKWGVPNIVPADKMHVTVIASRKDVKTKPQVGTYQIFSEQTYIENLGLDASVLVVTWVCDWTLTDRYYQLKQFGAVSDWPDFRPHITLSYDAKGFELPDEALAEMPPSILFGGEQHSAFAPGDKTQDTEADDEDTVELEDGACAEAIIIIEKAATEGWGDIAPYDRQTLGLIAGGHPIRKSALERLDGKVDFLSSPQDTVSPIIKATEENRMVYGWASVSVTKSGAVVDSHKHLIKTSAIRKLVHGIMKGARAGKFDHGGGKRTDIVEAMIFEPDLWSALGVYLADIGEITADQAEIFKSIKFEGALLGFHAEDDKVWEMAKSMDFELSIGAEEATLQEVK